MDVAKKKRRQRYNPTECRFEERARSNGWNLTKRGWPDFICELPTGEVICVEVKPVREDGTIQHLKDSQIKVMEWLTEFGIRCFVSDGQRLEKFDPKLHSMRQWQRPDAKPRPKRETTP